MARPDRRASARIGIILLLVGIVAIFMCSGSHADVPQMINYQGKLTTATGGCLNDTVSMTFTIYSDSLGTSADWTETQTEVVVKEGIFSVLLGSVDSIPASVFDGNTKYLGVQVESDPEMRPLKPMVSTGYAFRSQEADTTDYARVSMPDDDWVIRGDTIYHEEGNVGIGATNPTQKLQINTGNIQMTWGNFSYSLMGGLRFGTSYNNWDNWAGIEGWTDNGLNQTYLRFYTSYVSRSEKMRITPTGNVGIGTTSPTSKLELVGDATIIGDVTIKAEINEGFALLGFDSKNNLGQPVNTGQIFGVCSQGASDARLGFNIRNSNVTGWTEALTLKNGGNVGIGTINPGSKLHVEGDLYVSDYGVALGGFHVGGTSDPGTDNLSVDGIVNIGGSLNESQLNVIGSAPQITVRDVSAGVNQKIGVSSSGLSLYYDGGPSLTVNRGNGNVGIGTTSPSAKLHVDNGSIKISGSGQGIYFPDGSFQASAGTGSASSVSNNLDAVITGDADANGSGGVKLRTGSNDRVTLLNNGNVGIGTTSPGAKLHVNGNVIVDGPGGTVNAMTANTNGTYAGVAGLNSGTGPGVYAESYSTSTIVGAVTGKGKSTGPGVYAESDANESNVGAVTGKAKKDGGSGVYGETWSLGYLVGADTGSSVAVYGWAPASGGSVGGAAIGVLGRVNSHQNPGNSVPAGVFGWATATSGINAGVWGETKSPDGFGVYSAGDLAVDGDFNCNGTKNAVVSTNYGDRELYCQESPEVWFEDFGEGELKNGYAHIDLDALFLETVTISEKYPMKVFVQLNDDCKGVYVKRGNTGFDVYELNNGKSNASFTYRVVAKRKGYEDKRLEVVEEQLSSK